MKQESKHSAEPRITRNQANRPESNKDELTAIQKQLAGQVQHNEPSFIARELRKSYRNGLLLVLVIITGINLGLLLNRYPQPKVTEYINSLTAGITSYIKPSATITLADLQVGAIMRTSSTTDVNQTIESQPPDDNLQIHKPLSKLSVSVPIIDNKKAGGVLTDTTKDQEDQAIRELLSQATRLEQEGVLFKGNDSAASRYLSILNLNPNQTEATYGLHQLINGRLIKIQQLIVDREINRARKQLAPVIERFPQHSALQLISNKLDSLYPSIASVTVNPQRINTTEANNQSPRTIIINFSYRNFTQDSTVVIIKLRSLASTKSISEVPVIITGWRGSMSATIDKHVDGFSDGSYQLDFLLAGEVIIKHPFSLN